ncbi:hypothetical protein AN641_03835 [Candidatus Epulonipiscioides gigas]|nr:hypothetical protein AN641_03835 [Epulopiscium sp. SCG-C07WGA-EpuloA2]
MEIIMNEVLNFVRENEVKFIRLAFCDIFGTHKNIAIMQPELEGAFLNGIRIDGSKILGFINEDLFLYPDPTTLSAMPWRPEPGCVIKFYCDIKLKDGTNFDLDSRKILKTALKNLSKMGYGALSATECEFYLFKQNENAEPTLIPVDNGGYLDVAPVDKGEDVRREICLLLNQIGIVPQSSHHEAGPGQNQIDFKYLDPLTSADNLITFKSIVKTTAIRQGLFASFMPKPLKLENSNGLNINISLIKHTTKLDQLQEIETEIEQYFIAGILEKAQEIALFLHPIVNSYDRVIKTQFITKNQDASFKCRNIGPLANPYIAYALIIQAGIWGIKNKSKIKYITLPKTLKQSIDFAKSSNFVKGVLGEHFAKKFISLKEKELEMYKNTSRETFYMNEYFLKL